MSNRALAFTAERLLQVLQSFPVVNSYIVGFSGGADSTALLHAISTIQNQLDVPVSAVHINHGLHDDADLWQLQCETFCRQNGIKLVCLRIKLGNRSGKGTGGRGPPFTLRGHISLAQAWGLPVNRSPRG